MGGKERKMNRDADGAVEGSVTQWRLRVLLVERTGRVFQRRPRLFAWQLIYSVQRSEPARVKPNN